jgi:putative flippase GtrA
MNTFIRWGKFNLVGAMGVVVQLAALALFNHWMAGRYLYASAAAIEFTLLHNFIWHLHYTWRDRRDNTIPLCQFVRFHLSNGSVSMLGNLCLMRLLVCEVRLSLLVSNVIAILCCSIMNFCLGNNWAFTATRKTPALRESEVPCPRPTHSHTLLLLLLVMTGAIADAQTPATSHGLESMSVTSFSSQPDTTVPEAPTAQLGSTTPYHSEPSDSYLYHVGTFCGVGASTSHAATKPTAGCGVGLTLVPLPVFFEVGVMAPQANRSDLSGYISLDSSIPLARGSTKYLPLAIVGYSRLFETGHSFDYGLAMALPRFSKQSDDSKSLRIELRDYYTFANPTQHNIMFRVGWMAEEAD